MCEAGADLPVPVPVPVESPRESPKHAHVPSNDDNWEPMPFGWMPWKPFKPISLPDDATPCKRHCAHPCGWSQSGGASYCCEEVPGKPCSQTQINGKCYCG